MKRIFLRFTALVLSIILLLPDAGAIASANYDPDNIDLKNWMKQLPDEALITEINIPGTHDSGTAHMNWAVSRPFASCVQWDIGGQLNHGIRYFDIRVATDSPFNWKEMQITHDIWRCAVSPFILSDILLFEDVLSDCVDFLSDHKDETIILLVSADDLKETTRSSISYMRKELNTLYYEYQGTTICYYTQKMQIPKLKDVRGKIVLIDDEDANKLPEIGEHGAALYKYEMNYEEDDPALRKKYIDEMDAGNTSTEEFKKAKKDYIDDVVAKKEFFLSRCLNDALQTKQLYTHGHGDSPGIFACDYYRNEDGHYGEPALKIIGTNINTGGLFNDAGKWEFGNSPTIKDYSTPIVKWLENWSWRTGARYGWISMDHPTDLVIKKIIATNVLKEKQDITVKLEWTKNVVPEGFDLQNDLKFHLVADLTAGIKGYEEVIVDPKDQVWNGNTLTYKNMDFYPSFHSDYKVVLDYSPYNFRFSVRKVSENEFIIKGEKTTTTVGVKLIWDCVPEHPIRSWPLVFTVTRADGTTYTTTFEGITSKNTNTETIVTGYFGEPFGMREYTVALDPSCFTSDSDFEYDPATDIKKTGPYFWEITLHTTRERKPLSGTVRFEDGNNKYGFRPGMDDPFWKDLIAVGVDEGIPTPDQSVPRLDFTRYESDGVVSVACDSVPVTDTINVSHILDWTLQIPPIKGYEISVNGMDVVFTLAKYKSFVKIKWINDTEDTRPSTLDLQLQRGNPAEGIPYKTISTQTVSKNTRDWQTSWLFPSQEIDCRAGHVPDDLKIVIPNIPLGYKASEPYWDDDMNCSIINMTYVHTTEITGTLTWYGAGIHTKDDWAKFEIILWRNGEILDKYTADNERLANNSMNYSFPNLEIIDGKGDPYLYSVSWEGGNDKYTAVMKDGNLYIYPLIQLKGEVWWFAKKGWLPSPEWITEKPKITLVRHTPYKDDFETMAIEPEWNGDIYEFKGLPFYKMIDGVPTITQYSYKVAQENIPGFTTDITPGQYNDFDKCWTSYIRNSLASDATVTVPFRVFVDAGGQHPEEDFEIELIDSENNVVSTKNCKLQNGEVESEILNVSTTLFQTGTYSYTLRQKNKGTSGWEYDDKQVPIEVTVSWDNEANRLAVNEINPVEFHNNYEYTVTVKVNDSNLGVASASKMQAAGGTVVNLTAKASPGYHFVSWQTNDVNVYNDSFVMPGRNVTITAVFEEDKPKPPTYIISVASNDASMGVATASTSLAEEGTVIELIEEAKEGYHFVEWQSSDVNVSRDSFVLPAKDVKITAIFASGSPETFTVNFNMGGHGEQVTSQSIVKGKCAIEPEIPTADGWTFSGWYADSNYTNAFNFDAKILDNTTVYAKWTEKTNPPGPNPPGPNPPGPNPDPNPPYNPPYSPTNTSSTSATTTTNSASGSIGGISGQVSNVSVRITGGNAVVSEIPNATIDAVANSKTNGTDIVIDVSKTGTTNATGSGVSITKTTAERISDVVASSSNNKEALVLKTDTGSVRLNAIALKSIVSQAKGSSILVSVKNKQTSRLNNKQRAEINRINSDSNKEALWIFEAKVESGGSSISDFETGEATVGIPVNNIKNASKTVNVQSAEVQDYLHVMYVSDAGPSERFITWVQDNIVYSQMDHFSVYAIVYDSAIENGLGKDVYRVYNPNSGHHFLTGNAAERDILVKAGWKYEGVAFKTESVGNPVYRLYNPGNGEHFFTVSENEKDILAKSGWDYEGEAFYSSGNKGVYRLFSGVHHYTTSVDEKDMLVKVGWKYEGVAFKVR